MEYKTINPALTVYFGFRSPGICLRVSNALTYFTPNPIGYFLRKNPGVAATKTLIEIGIYIYLYRIYIYISISLHIHIYFLHIIYIFYICIWIFLRTTYHCVRGQVHGMKMFKKMFKVWSKSKGPRAFHLIFLTHKSFFSSGIMVLTNQQVFGIPLSQL